MATGRLESDPLFLGLTRPAMAFGVTYLWFVLNVMTFILYFVNTSDFLGVLLGAPSVHGLGYFICSKEPRFMDIMMIKGSKCMRCKNARYHGNTHSYDLY